jgi:hypothetical protein
MPENLNPRVIELLSWHGHAGGGVHVPFQASGNPLGAVIVTPLVRRLRSLAAEIAASSESRPRWIFLVGGPGNGKSETVQDFLSHLDAAAGYNGALCAVLTQKFNQPGLLRRKVDVLPADLGSNSTEFAAKIGRLVIVQDATATDTAQGNAAEELAHDITDLLTTPNTPPLPVFVACANRGLLSRAMNEAFLSYGINNPTTSLIANVIQASSLGRETLAGRKACWPLQSDDRFACWPLDVDSLLSADGGTAPLDEIITQAVNADLWETPGRCQDCDSRNLCPLRSNAESLRDGATKANLLALLRRGELARGQRWSFRDAFSLVAELIVGQWDDFHGVAHPCEWVHQQTALATTAAPDTAAMLELALHLYHHALFGRDELANTAADCQARYTSSTGSQSLTAAIFGAMETSNQADSTKPIREMLARDYSKLDPAIVTHADPTHVVRVIEEAFCQSVEQGAIACQGNSLPTIEAELLQQFDRAEREWDLLGRDSATAVAAVCVLRKTAAMIAKRSIGVRLGYHALQELLQDYEACLRDPALLRDVRNALQPLLGQPNFAFNLVEILGQPTAESDSLISLQGTQPGILAQPAPSGNATTPGHDVPCIEIRELDYRIPLTFDFYMAIRLRKGGCAGSSLPASVRAALDRVRHRYAGELCRDEGPFILGSTIIKLPDAKTIGIIATGNAPSLIDA